MIYKYFITVHAQIAYLLHLYTTVITDIYSTWNFLGHFYQKVSIKKSFQNQPVKHGDQNCQVGGGARHLPGLREPGGEQHPPRPAAAGGSGRHGGHVPGDPAGDKRRRQKGKTKKTWGKTELLCFWMFFSLFSDFFKVIIQVWELFGG